MGIHDLWLFVLAGLLLNLTPGPDMALVVTRSTRSGTRAGLAAALGIGAGTFVHITAAAVGISAIVMASGAAFAAIKWIGALYLIFVGLQMIRGSFSVPSGAGRSDTAEAADFGPVFLQGFLTNVFNPKVAAFFLAFLPQFIDANAPSKVLAFVLLGSIFCATGTAWNLAVAWMAGRLGAMPVFARAKSWLECVMGVMFIGVGAKLALAERS